MAFTVHHGNAAEVLRTMSDGSIDCCVTSPPYWGLRDYGEAGQIGLEKTPALYVERLVEVFSEVRRVLKPHGTCWINLGDSYATGAGKARSAGGGAQGEKFKTIGPSGYRGSRDASPKQRRDEPSDSKDPAVDLPQFQPNRMPIDGLKPKDLIGMPWRVAFALQADGWWLRQDVIWHKPNPLPESVQDRCTKAHEYVFLLTKSKRYFWDIEAMREPAIDTGRINQINGRPEPAAARPPGTNPRKLARLDYSKIGRNKRSVWTIATQPTPEAHFATFPLELPELCLLAGCPPGGVVLDPFSGAGTTGMAAIKNGRRYVGIEINQEYIAIFYDRLNKHMPLLAVGD